MQQEQSKAQQETRFIVWVTNEQEYREAYLEIRGWNWGLWVARYGSYTCTGQWVWRTIGNYWYENERKNNGVQDNNNKWTIWKIGAIVLENKRTGYNAMGDTADDAGGKLSGKEI